MKFFCCIILLIFITIQWEQVFGMHRQQYGQSSSSSSNPVDMIPNGKTALTPPNMNLYPLSEKQLKDGLNQDQVLDRLRYIGKWHPELEQLLRANAYGFSPFFAFERLMSRSEYLKDSFNNAFGIVKTNDYADINEILVTAMNEEKRTFSCGKISSFLFGMGGRKVDLFVALCKKPRDTTFAVDERLAREVADFFYNYFNRSVKDYDEREIYKQDKEPRAYAIKVLAESNYSQLRQILKCYKDKHNRSLHDKISGFDSDDVFYKTVLAILDDATNGRVEFFARLLQEKITKLNDKVGHWDTHEDVQRILVTRFQIDLGDIVAAYNRRTYRQLRDDFLQLQEKAYKKEGKEFAYQAFGAYVQLIGNWDGAGAGGQERG